MTDELQRRLDDALARFRDELGSADSPGRLYELQVRYTGKKGAITALRAELGPQLAKLAPADRKTLGQAFNATKVALEAELAARRAELEHQARQAELARPLDLTGVAPESAGSLHIITMFRRELRQVFSRMGFDVEDGPHIEHERYNFDDLNMPGDHPARDMQDTFFVNDADGQVGPLVLRTHTSPVQIRTMLRRPPPIRMVAMGTVFRRDDDATHSPVFHQIEGLYVDRGVTMADLKATLYRFVGEMFGSGLAVRLRPSYFPFVEPGAEFDMQCHFCRGGGCGVCKRTGFIELGGSGMVHPHVLRACGIDPEEFTGWAFGFGIDRMAMLKHGVHDLRLMFEGDVRFLEQFPC